MSDLTKLVISAILLAIIFFSGFYVGYKYRDYKALQQQQQDLESAKKAQEEVDSLRKQLNDKIKQQNADIAVKKQSIDESNQQTTTEIIKYVKESSAASDVLDDDFVRVYNESLPTD